MLRYVLIIMLSLAVTACAGNAPSLPKLRSASPTGTPYQQALAGEYLKTAERFAAGQNWQASQFFADKGLQAAYGKDVPMETMDSWTLSPESRSELYEASQLYHKNITDAVREATPSYAAQAQVFYDCWLYGAANNLDELQVDMCRQPFYNSMLALNTGSGGGGEYAPLVSNAMLLFFEWDSDLLTAKAMDELDKLVKYLSSLKEFSVVLNGHTDRSGTEDYNLDLSLRRAESVKNILLDAGISEKTIEVFAFGESDPRMPTSDGVREPANRRVEIYIE